MINHKYCMADIETLGTRPGDTILSIGACMFTHEGVTEKFYVTISGESSKAAGLRAQRSTIEWWAKQSAEAKAAAFKGEFALDVALDKFTAWLGNAETTLMYGNGANFDNALIAAAYRAVKKDPPWKFWNDRCYRTLAAMFLDTKVERTGTYHHALDDAITQAERLIYMVNKHGIVLK